MESSGRWPASHSPARYSEKTPNKRQQGSQHNHSNLDTPPNMWGGRGGDGSSVSLTPLRRTIHQSLHQRQKLQRHSLVLPLLAFCILLAVLFMAMSRSSMSIFPSQQPSNGSEVTKLKITFSRGHRNWGKHLKELLNHTNAYDYSKVWAPVMGLAQRLERIHGLTPDADKEKLSLCEDSRVQHLLRLIRPRELDPRRLKSPVKFYRPQVKLAFILLSFDMETVHGSERLLHWLYHPDHTFVFHIDSGASELYSCYLKRKYATKPNVHFSRRERSAWGSFGVVQAEVSGLRTALAADDKWDMALPITGSTLPIKPLAHIDCFIKRRQQEALQHAAGLGGGFPDDPRAVSMIPTQDLHAADPRNPERTMNFDRTPSVSCADEGCTVLNGTPGGAQWWKGSQWHMLGRMFVEFALNDPQAAEWLEFFSSREKFSFASDESWANTIAKHSRFNATTIFPRKAGLTLALWRGRHCKSHRNPRAKTSPCYLGTQDWEDMLHSKPAKLFARKFIFNDPVVPRVRDELVKLNRKPDQQALQMCGE